MKALVWIFVGVSILLGLAGRFYHIAYKPEWSEAMVLRELWWLWLIVLAMAGLALAIHKLALPRS